MNEVSVVLAANLSGGDDWWSGVPEEDASLPMPLDASEFGLWAGTFVPPPPRPLFLDEATATPDGLTTCDLCSWAWQNGNAFAIDTAIEAPGEIGWVFTLVIVSIISAIVGAGIMITVLHCKSRLKSSGNAENGQRVTPAQGNAGLRPPISTPSDKSLSSEPAYPPIRDTSGVWSWLTSKKNVTGPAQLTSPAASATENHYTHMDETYGEALYAELDRDSNSPAYQNSAYADPDAPTSSAPSSAYYSDLSVSTAPERAYEVVGLTSMPSWESRQPPPPVRLAAIRETAAGGTMPSDYV